MDNRLICDNLSVTADGKGLLFAGRLPRQLMEKYGSGLYVMDETRIRHNARQYVDAMREHFGADSYPLYASKAASFKQVYRIVGEEGMGVDVVSCGELYTAKAARFDMSRVYFHGNHKTDEEIRFAMEQGIGYFVADSREEIDAIDAIAGDLGLTQSILLRLTPGIDPHTYEAVATGKVDSKFGFAIETGAAEEITRYTLDKPHIHIAGFHCHVGSMVFDSDVYIASADIMLRFVADMQSRYSLVTEQLNLGGGYGVRYVANDPTIDIPANIARTAAVLKEMALKYAIDLPAIRMEPGRSIVADAGITLYTAGTVKSIPGYKNYVCVDGGMTDNPRYALYQSSYTVLAAEKLDEPCDFSCDLVGRCCESGDIIQPQVTLPASVTRGDIIAVLTTGAYNYSMASNYNRYPRFPVVMVNGDEDYLAVRRETLADVSQYDV